MFSLIMIFHILQKILLSPVWLESRLSGEVEDQHLKHLAEQ